MAWIDSLFQRETIPVLDAGLAFAHQKQLVTMNNLANVETPYYKRQTVPEEEFYDTLKEAIYARDEYHPQSLQIEDTLDIRFEDNMPRVRMFNGKEYGPERHDENSVVVEQEMVNLAKNELKIKAMQRLMKQQLTQLRDAANKASR